MDRKKISVKRFRSGYIAFTYGKAHIHTEPRENVVLAIGALVIRHQDHFGLNIKETDSESALGELVLRDARFLGIDLDYPRDETITGA